MIGDSRNPRLGNPNGCVPLTFNGETHNQSEWAIILGISRTELWRRLKSGLSHDLVFTGPRPKRINKRSLRPKAIDDPNRDISGRFVPGSNGTPTHRHNQKNSATYRTWAAMRARCLNPNSKAFKYYGARGIGIDSRWDSFEMFLVDMGERPIGKTLDRIDNDGNYCNSNCRWSTPSEQASNKRQAARFYTLSGLTLNQSQWAEKIGINRSAFVRRIAYGWTEEEILQPPIPFDRTRKGLKRDIYGDKLFR